MTAYTFTTSTYSQKQTDWKCVAVGAPAIGTDTNRALRDSTRPAAELLELRSNEFAAFLAAARA